MDLVVNTNLRNSSMFSIEDAQKAITFKANATPNYRYIVHRLTGFSPEQYTDMEYDLSESARIIDTEALVAESFKKKKQLILKNGYLFDSKNEENLKYIKNRLEEFEFVTQQTFRDLLSEIVENMVNFNNCFVLKYRKEENSSGQIRSIPSGKEFKPIAGLYVLAAPTIDTANDRKTGRIVKYRHRIREDRAKYFKPQDIYHIAENRRVGITIGTPPLEAVKDDIVSLRMIEQMVETMIHKNASPFVHVKVGTDNQPARILGDGTSEVDIYASIIDQMEDSGGVATPHRVAIDLKGSESQALRLEGYLNYFKSRVLLGLSVSESDLGGVSSNDGIYQSLREDIRSYQETISHFVSNYIFNELLLESPKYGNKFYIPEDERVSLLFLEPDEDAKIKMESHGLNLYVSGLITKQAAIRGTRFTEDDLQPDPPLELTTGAVNKTNSVRKAISNNIISPTNQHTSKLLIKDNLTYDNYFDYDIDKFKINLHNAFPVEDIKFERFIKQLHNKAISLREQFDLNEVNKIIEETIISVL